MYDLFSYEEYPNLVFLVTVLFMILMLLPLIFPRVKKILLIVIEHISRKSSMDDNSIYGLINSMGYEYDARKDIFYSQLNAWQRDMGYCRLYDEAAAPMSMIIDCEPIYFQYDNKRWMIEFWKGQYGMTTGCEIGVYYTKEPDINNEFFNGTFYECAGDEDLLKMSMILYKNNKLLFRRRDVHWWLTGFMLGEFSEPEELTMDIELTLKDSTMREEFVKGLKEAGYADKEIVIINDSIMFFFNIPKTVQPYTRNEITDDIIQMNNKELCDRFSETTKDYDNSIDKLIYIKEAAPDLFEEFYKTGKNTSIFNNFYNIKTKNL